VTLAAVVLEPALDQRVELRELQITAGKASPDRISKGSTW
jgi:hypothetical protein